MSIVLWRSGPVALSIRLRASLGYVSLAEWLDGPFVIGLRILAAQYPAQKE